MKIKKGDKVKIMLGKDRGKEGTVEYLMAKTGRVFVGGANLYKRHVRKMQGGMGGIIDIPKSINISNVGLICPHCKRPTKVGYKLEKNTKIRICRRCHKAVS